MTLLKKQINVKNKDEIYRFYGGRRNLIKQLPTSGSYKWNPLFEASGWASKEFLFPPRSTDTFDWIDTAEGI